MCRKLLLKTVKIVFLKEKIEKELNGIVFIVDKNGNPNEYIDVLIKSEKPALALVGDKSLIKFDSEKKSAEVYGLINNLELKLGKDNNFLEIKSNEKKFNLSKKFVNSLMKFSLIAFFCISFIIIFSAFWIVKLF